MASLKYSKAIKTNFDFTKFFKFKKNHKITDNTITSKYHISSETLYRLSKGYNVDTSTIEMLISILDDYEPNKKHTFYDVCEYK